MEYDAHMPACNEKCQHKTQRLRAVRDKSQLVREFHPVCHTPPKAKNAVQDTSHLPLHPVCYALPKAKNAVQDTSHLPLHPVCHTLSKAKNAVQDTSHLPLYPLCFTLSKAKNAVQYTSHLPLAIVQYVTHIAKTQQRVPCKTRRTFHQYCHTCMKPLNSHKLLHCAVNAVTPGPWDVQVPIAAEVNTNLQRTSMIGTNTNQCQKII